MMVSICIPCYNRSKMLIECIESFVKQNFQDWELIVADDGSIEDLSFVTNIDKRVKYFKKEHSGLGPARARNLAVSESSGKYILIFDSDDIAFPYLLDKEVSFLEKHPEFDAAYTNYTMDVGMIRKRKVIVDDCNNTEEDYCRMLEQQFIPHSGLMIKHEKLPKYDEGNAADDWDMLLTAMENGVKFHHIDKICFIQRVNHEREAGSERQIDGCHRLLAKRGYIFNEETRRGERI